MKKLLYFSKGLLIFAVSLMLISCHTNSYYKVKSSIDSWEANNKKAQKLSDLQFHYGDQARFYFDGCNADEQCTIRQRIYRIKSMIEDRANELAVGTYLLKNKKTGAEIGKLKLLSGKQAKIYKNGVLHKTTPWVFRGDDVSLIEVGEGFRKDIVLDLFDGKHAMGVYVDDMTGSYHGGEFEKIK